MRRMTGSICFFSAKPRGSIRRSLSPQARRRTAQCSRVLRQRRGERRPTTKQAFSSDVALLRIARRTVEIVLQVDWRRYNEHFRPRRRRSRQHVLKAVSFSRHGIQHDWKDTISVIHVSPVSAETLVRRGGITNHHLIAYSLSNISAKNYPNQLMWVEVIVCYISVVFWDTVYM